MKIKQFWLSVVFEFIGIFTLSALISPPAIQPNYTLSGGFAGFIHGLISPFTYIISKLDMNSTYAPTYVIDDRYWDGYSIGLMVFVFGICDELRKLYIWRWKTRPRI